VRLNGPGGVLDGVDAIARVDGRFRRGDDGPTPTYDLSHGGRITFEPGGQIEHSTAIHDSAARAMADIECTTRALVDGFAEENRALAAVGVDLWHEVEDVPQQLCAPRYTAMQAYFARRGPEGAVMMRHSTSLQVNLDLGPPAEAELRYVVANLASPVACASFASSPRDGAASRRARAWQGLDPTRTGFPRGLLDGATESAGALYAEFALDADVMLFRRPDGSAAPGEPGFRFRDWLERGHEEHGRPTCADLGYHLSTLFPEVRLRGFLELRAPDSLPTRWRAAIVAFWTGLLYDGAALRQAAERLGGLRADLPRHWKGAADRGLADPELGAAARDVWRIALDGARRLATGFHRPADLVVAECFEERFIQAGASPAEELSAAHREGPAVSFAWAREEARCEVSL
jgi:glutamate--cysteine ligase